MKKLMFVAAAFACGSLLALESANVVGYAQTNLRSGAKIVTPQFLGIGTTDNSIGLQSIRCNDDDSDCVFISTLDSVGAIVKTYSWINYGGENGDESCWIDTDTLEMPEKPVNFTVGQSLWVEADSEVNVFVSAGQVCKADVAVQLQSGATLTGNCTPVALNLQEITCRDDDSDCVFISTLDSVGAIVKTYSWINYGGENGDESCWIDTDTLEKPVKAVTFAPGEGLWVEGDSDENVITFPGVEL